MPVEKGFMWSTPKSLVKDFVIVVVVVVFIIVKLDVTLLTNCANILSLEPQEGRRESTKCKTKMMSRTIQNC